MKVLPDKRQSRPLAIGLLIIAAILVYFVGFHWFFQRHGELSDRIDRLETQIARYKGAIEMRAPMMARLNELRATNTDSALFLSGPDVNLAGAELIRLIREQIDRHASDPERCSISNTQSNREREPERFQAVRVNVRMMCPLDDFMLVLHALESGVPMLFFDSITINQRYTPDQANRRGPSPYGLLDIRFDARGYINQPGEVEEA